VGLIYLQSDVSYALPMCAVKRSRKRGPGRPSRPITKEELLEIALSAFAESGYNGTSTATIAGRAGLTKASLFHHFPTKESLYMAAVGGVADELVRLMVDAKLGPGNIIERQDRFCELAAEYLGTHRESAQLFLRDILDNGPYMKSGGAATLKLAFEMAAGILEAGMDDGLLRRQDPKQLVISIVGIHLFYFGAIDLTQSVLGAEIFSREMVDTRKKCVVAHVKQLTEA